MWSWKVWKFSVNRCYDSSFSTCKSSWPDLIKTWHALFDTQSLDRPLLFRVTLVKPWAMNVHLNALGTELLLVQLGRSYLPNHSNLLCVALQMYQVIFIRVFCSEIVAPVTSFQIKASYGVSVMWSLFRWYYRSRITPDTCFCLPGLIVRRSQRYTRLKLANPLVSPGSAAKSNDRIHLATHQLKSWTQAASNCKRISNISDRNNLKYSVFII